MNIGDIIKSKRQKKEHDTDRIGRKAECYASGCVAMGDGDIVSGYCHGAADFRGLVGERR